MKMKYKILFILALLPLLCFGGEALFSHDLHLSTLPGTNARTLISFHGYGGSYKLAETLRERDQVKATLISFNFPDHDFPKRGLKPEEATFGTIKELLPAFYVLKKQVLDQKLEAVDLHGFSAGGAALVNLLAILNSNAWEKELKQIGIGNEERQELLKAIQKGVVILDVPLKSVEEIIALRGPSTELALLAGNYRKNGLRPLDSLDALKGLSLHILLHFQNPDHTLSNRDDSLYIEKLKKANYRGTTHVIIGTEGGHTGPHTPLWQHYNTTFK